MTTFIIIHSQNTTNEEEGNVMGASHQAYYTRYYHVHMYI